MSVYIQSQSNNNIRCRRTYWANSCRRYLRLYVTRPRSEAVRTSVSLPSKKRSRQLSPCRLLLPTSPPRRRHSVARSRPPTSDRLAAACWSVPSHHQAAVLVRPPRRLSVAVVSLLTDPLRTRSLVSADVACAARSPPFRAAAANTGFTLFLISPWNCLSMVCLSFMFPAYTCLHCCSFMLQ